jgi:hypothetical protein
MNFDYTIAVEKSPLLRRVTASLSLMHWETRVLALKSH